MTLFDVNVLVYAHKRESLHHAATASWLTKFVESREAFVIPDVVATGFLRIVTHPRIYTVPSTISEALAFITSFNQHVDTTVLHQDTGHWPIFAHLCTTLNAHGNAIPDIYLAALALEYNLTLASADRGFSRIPNLKWLNPLDV